MTVMNRPALPLRIHMTGSEWFGSRAGGLNRYFESLFIALTRRDDVHVTADAFGEPVASGAGSWGPTTLGTLPRVRSSWSRPAIPAGAIVDRHFSLYGPLRGPARNVFHFHGPWAQESAVAGDTWLQARAKYLIERLSHARVEKFIVLADAFRDVLIDDYGVSESRIAVLPPGVDLEKFRIRTSTEPSEPIVLCVRRLERRMGIDVLLHAWSCLASHASGVKLVIVGTGSEESSLRELVNDLGLESRVQFAGRVSEKELVDLYSRALFTVVPSVALEGFGLIALESLAAGRAPIVTNCGGLPDSVQGFDESLIVQKNDVAALAQRLESALAGDVPDAERCRAHAETFSWDQVAERHVRLYREISGQ